MKKTIPYILLCLVLIAGVSYLYMQTLQGEKQPIDFGNVNAVQTIEIENPADAHRIAFFQDIPSFLDDLQNACGTRKQESVSDQPVGVEQPMLLTLYTNETAPTRIFYIYEKNRQSYIEEPYVGIWQLSQTMYQTIQAQLEKGR